MLSDELMTSKSIDALGAGVKRFRDDLTRAHRFVLDEQFTAAADEMSYQNPSAFERALPLCKLPYPVCWFETCFDHRRRFVADAKDYEGHHSGVKRIGVLAEEVQGAILLHLAYSFRAGPCSISPIALLLDPNAPRSAISIDRSHLAKILERPSFSQADAEAIIRLSNMAVPRWSPYCKDVLAKASGLDEARFRAMTASWVADWNHEPPFWQATLALLNSRNLVEEEFADQAGINRARRRLGRPPLLDHRVLRISARLRKRLATEMTGPSSHNVRAHFVRGHFKARKSGIYWWSPFIRGDKSLGFVSKDYALTGEAA